MPAGMVNLGNTCYISTVVQCLAHCPIFTTRLAADAHDPDHPFAAELDRVINALSEGTQPVHPGRLLPFFKGKWDVHDAQDVPEFFLFLLETLNAEVKTNIRLNGIDSISSKLWRASITHWFNSVSSEYSFLKEVFYGQYMQRLTCGSCGALFNTFEVFCCMALPMPKEEMSLASCVREFFTEEAVTDWKCDGCGTKGTAKRGAAICKLPEVVVVSVNRFDAGLKKNTAPLKLPDTLDLAKVSIINACASYDLVSFACHAGAFQAGHYWAIVKHVNEWLRADDVSMTRVSDVDVYARDWYVAFYQRRL